MNDRRTGDQVAIDGSYQYNAYHTGGAVQRFWHYAKYDEAEKLLGVKAGDMVLDVGCGSGVLANNIALHHPDAKVIGVDGNKSAVDFCSSKYSLPNLSFRSGLVDELNFKEESINKIVFLEVIEHIYYNQAKEVLTLFNKLLVKGGRLVVSTPNYNSLWPAIEWMLDKFSLVPQLADEQHVAKYDGEILVEIGIATGFRPVARKSVNFIAPWANVLGNGLAKSIHEIEVSGEHNLGSVLVYSFEKA